MSAAQQAVEFSALQEVEVSQLPILLENLGFQEEECKEDSTIRITSNLRNGSIFYIRDVKDERGSKDFDIFSIDSNDLLAPHVQLRINELFPREEGKGIIQMFGFNLSPDASKLVFGRNSKKSLSSQIHTVDLRTRELKSLTKGEFACFSPDGQRIIYALHGAIKSCDLNGRDDKILLNKPDTPENRFDAFIFNIGVIPNGSGVYFYRHYIAGNTLNWLDFSTGIEKELIPRHLNASKHASFSPDSSKLIFLTAEGKIGMKDMETGVIYDELDQGYFGDLVWSPDGRSINFFKKIVRYGNGPRDYNLFDGVFDIKFLDGGRPVLTLVSESLSTSCGNNYTWQAL